MAVLVRALFLLCVGMIAAASAAGAPPSVSGGVTSGSGASSVAPQSVSGGARPQGTVAPATLPAQVEATGNASRPSVRPAVTSVEAERPSTSGSQVAPKPKVPREGEQQRVDSDDDEDRDDDDDDDDALPSEPCPNGQVRFSGEVLFESEDETPSQALPSASVLTITLTESDTSGPTLHTEERSLPTGSELQEVPYSFCAAIPAVTGDKLSLVGQVTDKEDKTRVYFLGETVVTKGSTEYEADISLVSLLGGSLNAPSIEDCGFSDLPDDVFGAAIRLSVSGSFGKLPQPSILVVTLRAPSEGGEEPEVVSVFSGDVSGLAQPGQPLPAFLCAKIPATERESAYSVQAALFVGWEGRENDGEERVPRKGDFVATRDTKIQFVSAQHDYSADIALSPYEG